MQNFAEAELSQACRILFETESASSRDFLRSLSLACLKSAYRRRALQVHPDLQVQNEHVQQHYGRLFQELTGSYRLLCRYLKQKPRYKSEGFTAVRPPSGNGTRPEGAKDRPRPQAAETADGTGSLTPVIRDSLKVPAWQMRLGEFLYFSGQISWRALIDALMRQRRERLRLGDIAKRWGWLTEERIVSLLDERRPGERIGDLFVRLQLMTEFRLGMLLCHQRRHCKPIGNYFVESGLLSPEAIQSGLLQQNSHNRRYARV